MIPQLNGLLVFIEMKQYFFLLHRNENKQPVHMRYHLYLRYGWFLQNLEKDYIPTKMHTTVDSSVKNFWEVMQSIQYYRVVCWQKSWNSTTLLTLIFRVEKLHHLKISSFFFWQKSASAWSPSIKEIQDYFFLVFFFKQKMGKTLIKYNKRICTLC